MLEQLVTIDSHVSLKGTMVRSETEELQPAVLIISGSGPLDRDGNGKKKSQQLNIYNKLATMLKDMGVVSLRFDKRGTGESEGNFLGTGFSDLIEDAKAAYRHLEQSPYVDNKKIFILGHSEGSMIATAMAETIKTAGFILLAGAAQTLQEAIVWQRELMQESMKQQSGWKGVVFRLLNVPKKVGKQGEKLDRKILASTTDTMCVQGIKMNVKWFREHYLYDYQAAFEAMTSPVLAITGEYDLQATPKKVYDMAQLIPGECHAVIVPKMNHMLREQKDVCTILELNKAYKNIGEEPLSPSLETAIKDWLTGRVNDVY